MIYRNKKTGIDIITSGPVFGDNYVPITEENPVTETSKVVGTAEKVSEEPKKEVKKSKKGAKK